MKTIWIVGCGEKYRYDLKLQKALIAAGCMVKVNMWTSPWGTYPPVAEKGDIIVSTCLNHEREGQLEGAIRVASCIEGAVPPDIESATRKVMEGLGVE